MSHLKFNPSHENAIKEAMISWRSEPHIYQLDSPNLMNGRVITPGNNWRFEHMLAFHMIPILDLDLQHVLPIEYVPSDMDKFKLLWKLDRDDIYEKNYEKLLHSDHPQDAGNQAQIIACIVQLMRLVERRKEYDSELSSTSDEGEKLDISSTAFASSLCKMFLEVLGLHNRYPPNWDYTEKAAYNIQILLGVTGNVRVDGVIVFAESRHNKQAAVWIEFKPLMYAPRNKSNYETTLPQKAAAALAIVQSRGRQHEKDQEVFGIEFSHHFATFWHAMFPAAYLSSIQTHKSLSPEKYVVLKRSKTLDLVECSDRFQFAQNMVGMMKYLSSGNAKIGNWR
jgi:hypothetical protein